MVSFEEDFPEFENDTRWCPASIADPHSDSKCYWSENSIRDNCLSKQRVKDAINIELSKARLLIKEHERNSALIEYFKGQIDMCIILLKRLED